MSKHVALAMTRVVELLNTAKLPKGNEAFLGLLLTMREQYLRTIFRYIAGDQYDTYQVQQRTAMLEACFVFYADNPTSLLSWFEANTNWHGPGSSYTESHLFAPTLIALLGAHEWGHTHHRDEWTALHEAMPHLISELFRAALRGSASSGLEMDNKWVRGELTNRLNEYFRFNVVYMPDEEKDRRATILQVFWDEYVSARKKGAFSPSGSAQAAISYVLHAMFRTMYIDEQLPMLLANVSSEPE